MRNDHEDEMVGVFGLLCRVMTVGLIVGAVALALMFVVGYLG